MHCSPWGHKESDLTQQLSNKNEGITKVSKETMGILIQDGRQSAYMHLFLALKSHSDVSQEEQKIIQERQSWAQEKGHWETRDRDTLLRSKNYWELYQPIQSHLQDRAAVGARGIFSWQQTHREAQNLEHERKLDRSQLWNNCESQPAFRFPASHAQAKTRGLIF